MKLRLRYGRPAPDSDEGWEKYSMPVGCSYLGGNVFGGTGYERIQITENSLENPDWLGGLTSFADIIIGFPGLDGDISGYERGLDLDNAVAYVDYTSGDVKVRREYFASYPDRALAGRILTSAPVSLRVDLRIPFLTEEEHRAKRGTVRAEGSTVIMQGTMEAYRIRFEGCLRVFSDGDVRAEDGGLRIDGSRDTYFVFCCGTNYELRPEVFLEKDNRKKQKQQEKHYGYDCPDFKLLFILHTASPHLLRSF